MNPFGQTIPTQWGFVPSLAGAQQAQFGDQFQGLRPSTTATAIAMPPTSTGYYNPYLNAHQPKDAPMPSNPCDKPKKFGFGTLVVAFIGFLLVKAAWPKIKPMVAASLAEFKSVLKD